MKTSMRTAAVIGAAPSVTGRIMETRFLQGQSKRVLLPAAESGRCLHRGILDTGRLIRKGPRARLQGYDALLAGGPIWAFGMSPVTPAFASEPDDLAGVKALPFTTADLRFELLGGLQGMSAIGGVLHRKGARVLPGVAGTAWASRFDAEKDSLADRIVTLPEG
ncbi:MAG TPA: hypothetical protein PK274_08835 [Candidatus Fermentibacter daniensis]|nr:MAG: hypothetical protein BWX47_01596 [candidate division Hyd24-12 bacterium ADurb.Bin004]HPH40317.1 hypothetical protein [Candidatus Fermentibacter daniensis]